MIFLNDITHSPVCLVILCVNEIPFLIDFPQFKGLDFLSSLVGWHCTDINQYYPYLNKIFYIHSICLQNSNKLSNRYFFLLSSKLFPTLFPIFQKKNLKKDIFALLINLPTFISNCIVSWYFLFWHFFFPSSCFCLKNSDRHKKLQ